VDASGQSQQITGQQARGSHRARAFCFVIQITIVCLVHDSFIVMSGLRPVL
jgi:hypothetical protein